MSEDVEPEAAVSDKEMNFRKVQAEAERWQERALAAEKALDGVPTVADVAGEADQWKAKYEAAEATAHRGILIEAGFLPDSGQAKALLRDLASGAVEPDPAAVVVWADNEYSFSPNLRLFSAGEAVQLSAAAELRQIQTQSVSDEPANIAQQISEAEQAGNYTLSRHLKAQVLASQMLAK